MEGEGHANKKPVIYVQTRQKSGLGTKRIIEAEALNGSRCACDIEA